MRFKPIQVCVGGKVAGHEDKYYAVSDHAHREGAMQKVVKLLSEDPDEQIDVYDHLVSRQPILRVGKHSPHDTEGRAWAYSEYWPTKILSKLRKFYPTIEGADHE